MQVSSDTQSILSIARQSALEKRSKDKSGGEAESNSQASFSSTGVSYGQGYASFQSALAKADIDTSTAASSAAASGAGATFSGRMSDALTQSDVDLIEKTTGLKMVKNGFYDFYDSGGNKVESGPAFEQAGALVFAMSSLRLYGSEDSAGNMTKVTGKISADMLQKYIEKYQNQVGDGSSPFSSAGMQGLKNAITILSSN